MNIMNIINLRAIAALCRTLSQEKFNMGFFRSEDRTASECGSVGCVLGHATVLETGTLPRNGDGNINFGGWSESFTGLEWGSPEWDWCFSYSWAGVDDTPLGAAKRIEWLLAGEEVPTSGMFTAEMVEIYS